MVKETITPEKAPDSLTFKLSTGVEVVMDRPRVKQRLEALKESEQEEEVQLIIVSKISTFDGERKNWNDLTDMDLGDYFLITKKFNSLVKLPKEDEGATKNN